jgi:hypothetical protein
MELSYSGILKPGLSVILVLRMCDKSTFLCRVFTLPPESRVRYLLGPARDLFQVVHNMKYDDDDIALAITAKYTY